MTEKKKSSVLPMARARCEAFRKATGNRGRLHGVRIIIEDQASGRKGGESLPWDFCDFALRTRKGDHPRERYGVALKRTVFFSFPRSDGKSGGGDI